MIVSKLKKKVVIIGAGFGGLQVIKSLANHRDYDIVVVDKKNTPFIPTTFIPSCHSSIVTGRHCNPNTVDHYEI